MSRACRHVLRADARDRVWAHNVHHFDAAKDVLARFREEGAERAQLTLQRRARACASLPLRPELSWAPGRPRAANKSPKLIIERDRDPVIAQKDDGSWRIQNCSVQHAARRARHWCRSGACGPSERAAANHKAPKDHFRASGGVAWAPGSQKRKFWELFEVSTHIMDDPGRGSKGRSPLASSPFPPAFPP